MEPTEQEAEAQEAQEAPEAPEAPHAAQDAAPAPKRRGRFLGSKNKPKQDVPTEPAAPKRKPKPPQIVGRPSDVEPFLDEAGQRAQEVERGAEAVEETAAVAAVAAEGVGEPLGTWGAWRKGQQPWRPPRARLLERWLARRELARRQRRGWPWASQSAQPTASRAARAGCWRTRSSGPSRAARTRPRNRVALPQSQSSRASSSSGQSRRSLPPPSFDQLARH